EQRALADWRQHGGVERLSGQDVGAAGDPLLDDFGRGAIITDAARRSGLNRYRPRRGSPLSGAGVDLQALFSIYPGGRDFLGKELPKNRPPTIGAHAGDSVTD